MSKELVESIHEQTINHFHRIETSPLRKTEPMGAMGS
jgi:hypothetical protein